MRRGNFLVLVVAFATAVLCGCESDETGGGEAIGSVSSALTCNPTTYEAESMTHSTGGAVTNGWNIWTNGFIATNHTFLAGPVTVSVVAWGSVAGGLWPHMLVTVGGQTIGNTSVMSATPTTLSFPFTATAGVKEIRIAFDNDFLANGEDRNLYVDKVTVTCNSAPPPPCAGAIYEAETMSHSTGGAVPNGWNIWTNGFIATNHNFAGGAVGLNVVAQGTLANGVGPHMLVSVGGTTVGDTFVSSAQWTSFPFNFSANAGSQEIRVTFDNDLLANGQDRNLLVDRVEVVCPGGGGAGGAGGSGGGGGMSGSAGRGGSAGSGGSAGRGGNAGTSGGAGRGGNGGTSGSAGRGGNGGTSGSGGMGGGGRGGNGGGGSGGTSGSAGTGGVYVPPTGGYVVRGAALLDTSRAVAHALRSADFYAQVADPQFGGYFTFLDRQGHATSTDKSFVVQSRDAYAFARAFMLSGDLKYLDSARKALDFLYAHGWDTPNDGFIFMGNQQGIALPPPTGATSAKWSFVQHYGLVGIVAMCEATQNALDCGWMDKGISSLERHMWDGVAGREGYFNNANQDFSVVSDKGFTPTVDGITTHVLYSYLVTRRTADRTRLLSLADNMSDRLVPNMSAPGVIFGFPETYNSDWSINTGDRFGFVGHMLKTAWCLGRSYLVNPLPKYRDAARRVILQMWNQGGFDRTNGGPNFSFNWDQGVTSTDKEYWQVEQAFTSGIVNWYVATSDADRAIFLEMADRSLDFLMTHMVDTQFGGIFFQTNADGSQLVRQDKGDQWEGAYHNVEFMYYAYLDGNLMLWHRPVTLFYNFEASTQDRNLVLTPVPIQNEQLVITGVKRAGVTYTDFNATTRSVHLPPGTQGVFAVTFAHTP